MEKKGECRAKKRKRRSNRQSYVTDEVTEETETAAATIQNTLEISELGLTVVFDSKCDNKEIQNHVDVGVTRNFPLPCHYHPRCLHDDVSSESEHDNSAKLLLQLAKHVFYKMMSKQKKKNSSFTTEPSSWTPTPIQLQSWPILISQEEKEEDNNTALNLIGISPTGSGKSLSYVIPLALKASSRSLSSSSFVNSNSERNVYGLIITPTRELTIQVSKVVALVCKSIKSLSSRSSSSSDNKKKRKKEDKAKNKKGFSFGKCTTTDLKPISSVAIYGGIDKSEQIQALIGKGDAKCSAKEGRNDTRENHSIIVTATPGRLVDILGLNDQSNSNHSSVSTSKNDHGGHDSNDNEDGTYNSSTSSAAIRKLFHSVGMFIIDEADRVAIQSDISKQVDTLLHFLKKYNQRQSDCYPFTIGLFSATLPQSALLKIDDWVAKPRVTVTVNSVTVGGEEIATTKNRNNIDKTIENQTDHTAPPPPRSSSTTTITTAVKTEENGKEIILGAIPEHIEQIVHVCSNHKKAKKLMTTINKIRQKERKDQGRRKGLMIVFFGRVKTLQYIYQLLQKENIQCVQLHSKMRQERREFQLQMFRSGKKNVLLATDIAARGLHVNNVEYIINYDFPGSLEQVRKMTKRCFH